MLNKNFFLQFLKSKPMRLKDSNIEQFKEAYYKVEHLFETDYKCIYRYRLCDACERPYMFFNFCNSVTDLKYCVASSDQGIKERFKVPDGLVELKRLQMSGIRILNRRWHPSEIDLLIQISKTKNHESCSIARSLIRDINKAEKRQDTSIRSQANFQWVGKTNQ